MTWQQMAILGYLLWGMAAMLWTVNTSPEYSKRPFEWSVYSILYHLAPFLVLMSGGFFR